MSNLIGICGFIGSGKDTVAKMFVEQGCVQDSFAAPLKDMCSSIFGWDRDLLEGDTTHSREFRETTDLYWTSKLGIDKFTPRLALQLLGTDIIRTHFSQDMWLNSLEYRIRKQRQEEICVVVSDARFKNELNLIKDLGGVVIHVKRTELPEWYDSAVWANNGSIIAHKTMETKYSHVHASEWKWVGYEFDYEIENTGTLSDLEASVLKICVDLENNTDIQVSK